jgi:hypothetical protein
VYVYNSIVLLPNIEFLPQSLSVIAVKYTDYTRLAPNDQLLNFEVAEKNVVQTDDDIMSFDDRDEDLNPGNDPENHIEYQRCKPPDQKSLFAEFDYNKHGLTYWKQNRGKERCLSDADVVSYNEFLTLKYGTHINIEYVFGQKACKYLFKYILKGKVLYVYLLQPYYYIITFFKGHESAYVKVGEQKKTKDGSNVYDYDEISAIFKVRYMTSFEAYLRFIGFPIVKLSHNFAYMTICTEDSKNLIFEDGNESMLHASLHNDNKQTGFFKLCRQEDEDGVLARTLRYNEVEKLFRWDRKEHIWIRRKEWDKKAKKFVPRTTPVPDLLVRVYTVSPKDAERYACRMLLLHKKGPRSFDDLKTVEAGHPPEATYVEAAKKLGLLTSDDHWIKADFQINLSKIPKN